MKGKRDKLSIELKSHSIFNYNVSKLLDYVVRGEHEAVQMMLNQDKNLIFKRDKVTDCSGRVFEDISAFEYALWALDEHMWVRMLDCIPRDEASKEVFKKLISQYNKVKTRGITYQLNEELITEKHFDFKATIINALQEQVDLIKKYHAEKCLDGVNKWGLPLREQWREDVGGAQKLFPMHVVNWYCSGALFSSESQFTSYPKLPSITIDAINKQSSLKQFYNWSTNKYEDWFSRGSELSINFAICKGRSSRGAFSETREFLLGSTAAPNDLAAMTKLCQVRTEGFANLKSILEERRAEVDLQICQIL